MGIYSTLYASAIVALFTLPVRSRYTLAAAIAIVLLLWPGAQLERSVGTNFWLILLFVIVGGWLLWLLGQAKERRELIAFGVQAFAVGVLTTAAITLFNLIGLLVSLVPTVFLIILMALALFRIALLGSLLIAAMWPKSARR